MLENLYESCGLLATYLATLLEGEIMLLTSVLSAKMGLFNYYWGLVAAFLGAYTQAWIKFLIAKKQGVKLLNKKPSLKTKVDKASVWFDKRPFAILTIYKFLYGMTTIIILMAGLRNITYVRFGIHVGIAIALWIAVIGGVGYFCAEIMVENINALSEYKWYVIGTLVVIGLSVWFFKHRPNNKHCLEPVEA